MKTIDWSTYSPKELYRALQTIPRLLLPWRTIPGGDGLEDVIFRGVVGEEDEALLVKTNDGWIVESRTKSASFEGDNLVYAMREADLILQVWGYILLTEADLVLK